MRMTGKKTFLEFIPFLVFILILSACSSPDNSVHINYIEYVKKEGDCETDIYHNCVQILFRYPEISLAENESVEQKINTQFLDLMMQPILKPTKSETIFDFQAEFIQDYNEFIKETSASQGWEVTRDIEVRYFNEDFISIVYAEYSFLGGAHPNNLVLYFNYSLETGNQIKLNDIFINNYSPELTKIGEEEFRALKKLDKDTSLNAAGFWFENDSFKLNNNFSINDKNLTFYYNNYEITAYAFGPTKLEIPLSKISHLMFKDGAVSITRK